MIPREEQTFCIQIDSAMAALEKLPMIFLTLFISRVCLQCEALFVDMSGLMRSVLVWESYELGGHGALVPFGLNTRE